MGSLALRGEGRAEFVGDVEQLIASRGSRTEP